MCERHNYVKQLNELNANIKMIVKVVLNYQLTLLFSNILVKMEIHFTLTLRHIVTKRNSEFTSTLRHTMFELNSNAYVKSASFTNRIIKFWFQLNIFSNITKQEIFPSVSKE